MTDLAIFKAVCDDAHCTGCLACVNACHKGAIRKGTNEEGFIRPVLHESLCIDCGRCLKVCPTLHPLKHNVEQVRFPSAYACWSLQNTVRRKSSSGGLFTELSKAVLSQGGSVYGAILDKNIVCVLSSSENENGIDKFRGSKYIQCDIGENRLAEIKKLLIKGSLVLFSGTPCQVAGLKTFLGIDYDNLITVDFLCHGVPSPKLFQRYVKYLEDTYHARIVNFCFRDKRTSWRTFNFKVLFDNEKEVCISRLKDPYCNIFLRDYALQKSCYSCQYTRIHRDSDITMADYWLDCRGKEGSKLPDDDKGISLCLVNTVKGEKLFESVSDNLSRYPLDMELVRDRYKYLHTPTSEPSGRKNFWADFNRMEFKMLASKYGYPNKISIADSIVMRFGRNKWNRLLIKVLYKIQYVFSKL